MWALRLMEVGIYAGSPLPELIPGRYIKIDGGDEHTNGTYFLTKVCHRISIDAYTTSFEVKGAKT